MAGFESLSKEALKIVKGFIVVGERINAIKAYREHTGAGLKEAKEAVENLESFLGAVPTGTGLVMIADKGRITVTKSIKTEARGEEDVSPEDEMIEVTPFVQDAARVRIAKGLTINTGNFSSARIDVDISIPCYKEEVPAAVEHVNMMVEGRLAMEAESVIALIASRKAEAEAHKGKK